MNFALILFIHGRLAQTIWMFMLIVGLWAGFYYLRAKPLDGQFFGIIAVGEILMASQAVLGLTMLIGWGVKPENLIHFLYGALSVLVFPAIYYYTQDEEDRRAALIWALAGFFLFGLSLRAIGTA